MPLKLALAMVPMMKNQGFEELEVDIAMTNPFVEVQDFFVFSRQEDHFDAANNKTWQQVRPRAGIPEHICEN